MYYSIEIKMIEPQAPEFTPKIQPVIDTAVQIYDKYQQLGGKVFKQFQEFIGETVEPVHAVHAIHSTEIDGTSFNQALIIDTFLHAEQKMLKVTDELTGIWNRRHIISKVEDAIKSQKNVHVAMLDLDHFKDKNDTYGHPFGDIALKEFTKLINSKINQDNNIDFGRFGGEEFILVFNGTSDEDVNRILEEIRMEIQQKLKVNCFQKAEGINRRENDNEDYTVSIGNAKYDPTRHTDKDKLLKDADLGAYKSKDLGRNRISHVRGS